MTNGLDSYRRVFETTGSDASSARSVPRFGRPNTSDSPSSNTFRARHDDIPGSRSKSVSASRSKRFNRP